MRLSNALLFAQAARHRVRLVGGLVLVVAVLTILGLAYADPVVAAFVASALPPASALALGAALALMLAGLAAAALATIARDRMLRADDCIADGADAPVSDDAHIGVLQRAAWPAGWPQIAIAFVLALAAAILSWLALEVPLPTETLTRAAVPVGIAALVACFPLLVVERHLAAAAPEAFPEAEGLSRLVRVLLAALFCIALGRLAVQAGYAWGLWAPRLPAVLTLAIGFEFAGRAVARCFVPFPVPDRAVGVTSAIAGLLRVTIPSSGAVTAAVRDTIGIDVSQSWALGFLRRALVPAIVGLVLTAWLLSGLIALPTDERAVYERFGRPVAILAPGLHVILPWPAGQARRIELGLRHDLSLAFDAPVLSGLPETDADRLWDRPHPGDATYLIASGSGDRQGFEVVDIDMRIVWSVGDADADALAFATQVESPAAVIRGLAGRRLATRFAGTTLQAVLVEDRGAFVAAFRAALQEDCDALHMGVRIAAIIVEAIHPPAGAAKAYHAVQASELRARVSIAQARGAAIETQAQARQDVQAVTDAAAITSADIVAAARSERVFFDADRSAWMQDAPAFLLERRLEQIGKVLPSRQLTIVDHRLAPDAWPLLDFRGTTALP